MSKVKILETFSEATRRGPLAVGLWLRCVHPFQITPKEIQTDVKDQHENLPVNFLFGLGLASKSEDCLSDKIKKYLKVRRKV